MRSRTREEYPHSLSYQEMTFTQFPPTTRVMGASTIDERPSPLKSEETSSFASYPRYPLTGPLSEAFFSAALTSSFVVFFSTHAMAWVEKKTTKEEVNAALKKASESGPVRGYLGYEANELVSSDFKGDGRSSIVDAPMTLVVGGNCVKVISWYDNEWGYSSRV